jgi:hypothetical protein
MGAKRPDTFTGPLERWNRTSTGQPDVLPWPKKHTKLRMVLHAGLVAGVLRLGHAAVAQHSPTKCPRHDEGRRRPFGERRVGSKDFGASDSVAWR